MTTILSTSGRKAVNISYNEFNGYRASCVQIQEEYQQVIEAKSFSNLKSAEKWAKKVLK